MIKVKLFKGELVDHALKRLRKRMQKENTLQEVFERRYFSSKSEKRKEAKKKAKYLNSFRDDD